MYKIAIPSYKRVDVFQEKTLAYLKKTNVILDNVYVFVANKEEYESYKKLNLKNIIIGVETIRNQRNFIRNYFNEGDCVFNIDDDVAGIYIATSPKDLKLLTDLNSVILNAFDICKKIKTKLWGLNAVKNSFYAYGKKPTANLKYIVGAAFGQIIDKDSFLSQTIDDKGDYERSIKYFIKFGSVLKINNICIDTNYYKSKGGMQMTRTKERVKASALYLLNKYPDYCKINTSKKNKEFFEIKLQYDSKRNNHSR
jgi:hypothetical protein